MGDVVKFNDECINMDDLIDAIQDPNMEKAILLTMDKDGIMGSYLTKMKISEAVYLLETLKFELLASYS